MYIEGAEAYVWIFVDSNRHLPSGVFTELQLAEHWIRSNLLSGILTRYPINISVYDWAITNGYFKVKTNKHSSPHFIGGFSSAYQEHYHYNQGARTS